MIAGRKNFDVYTFIRTLNVNVFSTTIITEAYLESEYCEHEKKESARQYIYRHINNLIREQLIVKLGISNGKTIEYKLTQKSNVETGDKVRSADGYPIDVISRLRSRLKETRSILLATMGETEAYKEMVEDIPYLQKELQEKYNDAKDKASKLLGKINAYEALIILYQQNSTVYET